LGLGTGGVTREQRARECRRGGGVGHRVGSSPEFHLPGHPACASGRAKARPGRPVSTTRTECNRAPSVRETKRRPVTQTQAGSRAPTALEPTTSRKRARLNSREMPRVHGSANQRAADRVSLTTGPCVSVGGALRSRPVLRPHRCGAAAWCRRRPSAPEPPPQGLRTDRSRRPRTGARSHDCPSRGFLPLPIASLSRPGRRAPSSDARSRAFSPLALSRGSGGLPGPCRAGPKHPQCPTERVTVPHVM
jgi:hypothetical protein